MATAQLLYNRWDSKVFGNDVMYMPNNRCYIAGPFCLDENKVFCHREIRKWTSLHWDAHVRRSLHKCLNGTYKRFCKIE